MKKGIEINNTDTLYDYLVRSAELYPNRVACIGLNTEKKQRDTLTYQELKDRADRFAAGLKKLGVGKGDIVSVQLPNAIEFPTILYAIMKLGAVFNGITSIYREREVEFILKRTESRVYIIPSKLRNFDHLAMALQMKSRISSLKYIITTDNVAGENDPDIIPMNRIYESEGNGVSDSIEVSDIAQIAFTSGTTGEPKGVVHTHQTLRNTVEKYAYHVNPPEPFVDLVVSPVGHQTGFLWGAVLSVYLGGTAVYLDIWNPATAWKAILEEKVTCMIAASPFLRDLVQTLDQFGSEQNSLSMISIPGAPIPRGLVPLASTKLNCRIVPAWGMTEYGVAIAVGADAPEQAYFTDGSVVNGANARVVTKDGALAGPEEEGDLQIRGEGLFVEYYKRPEITAQNFDGDWFKTGDRAVMSKDGYISLTGRTKDIIVRGGENVPVQELENLLFQWPLIENAAIVAMPDERLGERACAFVVPVKGQNPTLEKMREYLDSLGVTKQFWPERLIIKDELPVTASGKIQKYALREEIKKQVTS